MKAGVPYTGVEVSAANSMEECWDLVNVHEQTGKQLMIMENVCYRRDVMAILNMVRTNLFGELLHCRCGYEHDLREVKFDLLKNDLKIGKEAHSEAQWRGLHSVRRNGDLYPTHGLGPVGMYLDINRGNRFLTLSAMATKSRGLHDFVKEKAAKDIQAAVWILHALIRKKQTAMIRETYDSMPKRWKTMVIKTISQLDDLEIKAVFA